MARSFAELIILVTFSIMLGFIINTLNPAGIPLFGNWNPEKGLVYPGGTCLPESREIDDIGIQFLNDRQKIVFVDARTPGEFAAGHIPGAYNLPVNDVDVFIHEFLDRVFQDSHLILYCSGPDCHDASDLMIVLKEYGYQNISVYYPGINGWKQSGRSLDTLEGKSDAWS